MADSLGVSRACFLATSLGILAPIGLPAEQTVQVGPGNVFSPSTVTVAPGEAVIWNFNESHTSTSDATTGPEVWDSGVLSSGTFSRTFNTTGSYPYYCQLHSFPGGTMMNGIVTVQGGTTPTATATATVPPTLTATVTQSPTPTVPVSTATPTPSTAVGIPLLDARGRLLLALALGAAGVAALLLVHRH